MALKEVANTAATLAYGPPVSGPPATFTGAPSSKVKAGGAFVFLDGVQVTIPIGVTNGSCTSTAVGIGNMAATAAKMEGEGKPVIRKDDELTVTGIPGTTGSSGCTLDVTVKVSDAGQTKVTAQ